VPRGVQHHFHDALYVSIHRLEAANVHPKPARNGGTDLARVQSLAFDLAALQYILGQGLKDRFLTELKAEGFHTAQQSTLLDMNYDQLLRQLSATPLEPGPSRVFIDI
jgi:hypothetical protein